MANKVRRNYKRVFVSRSQLRQSLQRTGIVGRGLKNFPNRAFIGTTHISVFSEGIKKLDEIKESPGRLSLDIADLTPNELTQLLDRCTSLPALAIKASWLRELPPLNRFTNLETIELDCPRLNTLEAKYLPSSLKNLTIQSERLEAIDPEIFSLPLENLQLKCDDLTSIDIPNSDSLNYLHVAGAELREINFGGELSKLKNLKVDSNEFKIIPNNWQHLSSLESLVIEAPIEDVVCDFAFLKYLKKIVFLQFRTLDYQFVAPLHHCLQSAHIEIYHTNGTQKWLDWSLFNQLETLYLWNVSVAANVLCQGQMPVLQQLTLESCSIERIDHILKNSPQLRSVSILKCAKPIQLADVLENTPWLESLAISYTPLYPLPNTSPTHDYIHTIRLNTNYLEINDLSWFLRLKKLRYVGISGNKIAKHHAFLLPKFIKFQYYGLSLPALKFRKKKEFIKLCSQIERTNLTRSEKEKWVDYFAQLEQVKIEDNLLWKDFLDLSQINYAPLRKLWQTKLDKMTTDTASTLDVNTKIYLTGNLRNTSTQWRERLATLGFAYAKTYSADVTHVLIGVNCKESELLKEKNFYPLSEAQLEQYFNEQQPKFLQQVALQNVDNQMVENVKQLLGDGNNESTLVGLQMVKNGGLPMELVENILVIQKTSTVGAIRSECRKLLELNAPTTLLPLVRDQLSFKMIHRSRIKENDIRKHLRKLAKRVSVSAAAHLSCLLFEYFQMGLRFALAEPVEESYRKRALNLLLTDRVLNYNQGINYQAWRKNYQGEYVQRNSGGVKIPFPALDLLEQPITILNIANCKYNKLPEAIAKFRQLCSLDCSYNYLREIPTSMIELQHLEEINLAHNSFSRFPMILSELPRLRKIDLRHNPTYNPKRIKLEVPKAFIRKLPDCKVML